MTMMRLRDRWADELNPISNEVGSRAGEADGSSVGSTGASELNPASIEVGVVEGGRVLMAMSYVGHGSGGDAGD